MSAIKTLSGIYTTRAANQVERISDSQKEVFNKMVIYPGKAIDANTRKITANVGAVYVGERTEGEGDMTPDTLASADLPIIIQLPQGREKLVRDVLVQSDNAGDGIVFKYWPA